MRPSPTRQRKSVQRTLPAPVGGWNKRDALSSMEPLDAVILDDMFPDANGIRVRNGSQNHITGLTGNVETLMEWAGPASAKLIAAADNTFYDVSATATASVQATAMTSIRWHHTMFGTPAGNYLYAVNGADTPRFFDGSVWATSSLTGTGLTSNGQSLKYVAAHQQRLFYGQKNSLNVWYLPVNQIHGAVSRFPLESFARKGGSVVGVGSWTLDGGTGLDDMLVIITTEGEAIVYAGTDPSSASTWSLKGVYTIPRPIPDRCLQKMGGDLIVLCEDGFYPLSRALLSAITNPSIALSDKISGAVKDSSAISRAQFGWQACHYPRGKMLIFNVPLGVQSYQYVMNTVTGAWCRFTNWPAVCWATFQGNLFFGLAGGVRQADIGTADVGANIETDVLPAYQTFGIDQTKHWKMAKPIFISQGRITPALVMCNDFQTLTPTSVTTYDTSGDGTVWDVGDWDTSAWGGSEIVFQSWQSIGGTGVYGALRFQTATMGLGFTQVSTVFLFEIGGSL